MWSPKEVWEVRHELFCLLCLITPLFKSKVIVAGLAVLTPHCLWTNFGLRNVENGASPTTMPAKVSVPCKNSNCHATKKRGNCAATPNHIKKHIDKTVTDVSGKHFRTVKVQSSIRTCSKFNLGSSKFILSQQSLIRYNPEKVKSRCEWPLGENTLTISFRGFLWRFAAIFFPSSVTLNTFQGLIQSYLR